MTHHHICHNLLTGRNKLGPSHVQGFRRVWTPRVGESSGPRQKLPTPSLTLSQVTISLLISYSIPLSTLLRSQWSRLLEHTKHVSFIGFFIWYPSVSNALIPWLIPSFKSFLKYLLNNAFTNLTKYKTVSLPHL